LAVRHYGAIDAINHALHRVSRKQIVHGRLTSIMKNVIEAKLETILLIVQHASWLHAMVIRHLDRAVLFVYENRILSKVLRWTRPHAHLYCIPRARHYLSTLTLLTEEFATAHYKACVCPVNQARPFQLQQNPFYALKRFLTPHSKIDPRPASTFFTASFVMIGSQPGSRFLLLLAQKRVHF